MLLEYTIYFIVLRVLGDNTSFALELPKRCTGEEERPQVTYSPSVNKEFMETG